MYLKSIELTGFKSFADKTLLTFEKGITCVVGPNGSGKSNISDAIRWVMGEMSAKTLRGSNMQDVIFAGTQKRKPLGYAEVSITLDNSDKAFPVDYNEVTVTRRLYRSGESEYFINRSLCRLKDISEMFMDTGVGKEGYSIIGQGKVEEIISSKAEDRRTIFDDAAGISKYRHRRDEAERKLNNTSENMVRITDITSELEEQLEPLERQSEKARKYLALRDELKILDINMSLSTIEKNKAAIDEINKSFTIVTDELEKLQSDFSDKEAQIDATNAESDAKEAEFEELSRAIAANDLQREGYAGEIEILKNTIESNSGLQSRLTRDIDMINKRIAELKRNAGEVDAEKQDLIAKQQEQTQEVERLQAECDELNKQFTDGNVLISELKSDIITKLNDISTTKAKISSLEAFKNSFIERKVALEQEQGSLDSRIKSIQTDDTQANKLLDEFKAKKNTHTEKKAEAQTQKAQLQEQFDADLKSFNELNMTYNRNASRLSMLSDMERDLEGYAKSVKSVVEAHKKGELSSLKIYGALSGLIEVDKKYVTAIEIALGAALSNIVVENENDAKAAIEFLKKNKTGRVTFLPVSSVRARDFELLADVKNEPGFIGLASDLIGYDRRYDGVVKSLLGRTVVVDTIDNAIKISRKFSYKFKTVTLEGEVFNAGGAISGGMNTKSTGLLSRAAEIKSLKEICEKLKNDIAESKKKLDALQSEIDTAMAVISDADAAIGECDAQIIRLTTEIEQRELMLSAAVESKTTMTDELSSLEEQIRTSNDEIAGLINRHTKDEMDIEEAKQEVEAKERGFAQITEKREKLGALLTQKRIELNSVIKDISAMDYRKNDLLSQILDNEMQIESKKQDIDELATTNEDTEKEIAEKEELIKKTEEVSEHLKKQADELGISRREAKDRVKALMDETKETRERIYALKEEQTRIENKREKNSTELENVVSRLWEEYELTFTAAQEYKKDVGAHTAVAKRISELRSSIRALGNVNVDSIEEYKAVKERYEFLSAQLSDLAKAKAELEELIKEISDTMKEQFKEQFAVINEEFTKVFTKLFGGGTASLRLTDPTDILESGVEIEAQPPGKKLQNLSLLSGGEKAFTAIALLFAILNVRPTPFCVLDEIEAALDEPNVYRFADYVRDYSEDTQFILVSHRRGTMESADLLYGVTMQEHGVSKLLALKMDDVDNMNLGE